MAGRQRRLRTGAALLALALGPLAALAQDNGGLRMTLGVGFRAETNDNLVLEDPSRGRTSQFDTRLTFGLTDETRAGSLSITAEGLLRALDGPDGRESGFVQPALGLAWRRAGGRAAFDASAFLREADLDTLIGLAIDPETGEASVLSGEGTQRQVGGDLAYTFGTGEPFGLGLSAGLTDTSYRDAPDEVDNRRTRSNATLRFALDPATEATAGLGFSTYKEEGAGQRDTLSFQAGLTRDSGSGTVSATLFAEQTEDGTRSGGTLGRSYDLAAGRLSFSLGATRGVSGRTNPTGALDWTQELARGSLSLGISRSVVSGDGDAETLATGINAGLTQALSELSSLRFDLNAAEVRTTATGATTRTATLSATVTRSLPQDWALDAGVTRRLREEDGAGRASSTAVFLELRRAFEWRP